MDIIVEQLVGVDTMHWACEMTMHGEKSKVSAERMYRAEHSPIRCVIFKVTMRGIPSFVSTHLVRHKNGVEHFVQSMRDDRIDPRIVVGRNTPVNHGMLINAQALITISRKRLCLKAHKKTTAVWTKVRRGVAGVDPELAMFMVPECVYRNGFCPELRQCAAGVERVCSAYRRG